MDIQLLSEYLEYIEIEKGLSPNTIDAYRRDLSSFIDFCSQKGANDVQDIGRTHLNAYIMNLHDNNINTRSVVRKIA